MNIMYLALVLDGIPGNTYIESLTNMLMNSLGKRVMVDVKGGMTHNMFTITRIISDTSVDVGTGVLARLALESDAGLRFLLEGMIHGIAFFMRAILSLSGALSRKQSLMPVSGFLKLSVRSF